MFQGPGRGCILAGTTAHVLVVCCLCVYLSQVCGCAPLPQSVPAHNIRAESFYAPTFNRMWAHWVKRDMDAAFNEQMWKFNVSAVFAANGGGAGERTVYKVGMVHSLPPPQVPHPCASSTTTPVVHWLAHLTRRYCIALCPDVVWSAVRHGAAASATGAHHIRAGKVTHCWTDSYGILQPNHPSCTACCGGSGVSVTAHSAT